MLPNRVLTPSYAHFYRLRVKELPCHRLALDELRCRSSIQLAFYSMI